MSADKKIKKARRKGLRIPLAVKFGGLTSLLIVLIMAIVGSFVYLQQNRDLTLLVSDRAAAVTRNLASNSPEAILTSNVLDLAVMVKESVQDQAPDAQAAAAPSDWKEWLLATLNSALSPLQGHESPRNEGIVRASVVNKDGIILADSEPGKAGSTWVEPAQLPSPPPNPWLEKLNLDAEQPFPTSLDAQGRRIFDVADPIILKGTDQQLGTVHVVLDRGIVDRVVRTATARLVLLGLAAVVAGLLVIFLAVRYLVRPVGKLVRGVLAIAGGDFNQEVRINTKDELGDLTRAFNNMAKSLREKQTLEGAFTRYVSSAVMEDVYSDPSKAGSTHASRIHATLYSSDVRGFTAMSETMQPEEVVAVINEYLATQATLLTKAGAEVNKFVGDATVAVFGMREAKPNDPLTAVKTAMKIQQTLKKINEQRTKLGMVAKEIGIGINTGEMVVGNIGSSQKMEYTVIGDNVVLADKLCDSCPGGAVMISQNTYELVQGDVKVKALEPLILEGRKEPVQVYEVLSLN